MAEKDINPNGYCFRNLLWVPDDNLPEIEKDENYDNRHDKEINDLLTIQDELCQKIEKKEEEIVNLRENINRLLQQDINPGKKISYEKYEMALQTLQEEQEKNNELVKIYDELKKTFDQYKQNIEKKVDSIDVSNLLELHNRRASIDNELYKTQQSNSINNIPSVIFF
jgi:hypothetical protein